MKPLSELKVAIIGGGIGGASAAVALKKIGINADLYEQASEIKEVGAGIGMRATSVKFFKDWGIYDAIQSKTEVSSHIEIRTAMNHLIAKETWPALTDNPDENWMLFVHRADLIDIFLNQLAPENIHLNHKLEQIIDHGDYAEARFENGNIIEADLIIGADGVRSLVRNQLFSVAPTVYSGTHAYRAIVKDKEIFELVPDNAFKIFVDYHAQIYLMPLHHRNEVSFDVTAESLDPSWAPEVTNKEIVALLENFDPRLKKVAANVEHYVKRSIHDIDPLNGWHSNSVVLLGDAAHAMLHHQGHGANTAVQDSGVLAEELEKANSIPEALQQYQARRKPITDLYQKISRKPPQPGTDTIFTEIPEKMVLKKSNV
jgi:salicylate hydroxylase